MPQQTMLDSSTKRRISMEKDPSIVKDSNGVPSGFVLKLYQMVNGAPDDIISVSFPSCEHRHSSVEIIARAFFL